MDFEGIFLKFVNMFIPEAGSPAWAGASSSREEFPASALAEPEASIAKAV